MNTETPNNNQLTAFRDLRTGQISAMTQEDRAARDKFLAAYIGELKPEGALEAEYAQSAAEDAWRLRRARAIEDNIFALAQLENAQTELDAALANARAFVADPKKFQIITLYEQRLHRSMQKSLTLLRELQAERKAARDTAFEEAKALALTSYMKGNPYHPAKDFPPEHGFGFSTPEINLGIHRDRRVREAAYYKRFNWDGIMNYRPCTVKLIEFSQAA